MFILVEFKSGISIETFFWGCISNFRSTIFFFALNVSFRDLFTRNLPCSNSPLHYFALYPLQRKTVFKIFRTKIKIFTNPA